jgi:hypothetical protein
MIAFGSASTACCIVPTNTCGVDATALAMGCLDVSAAMGGIKYNCDGTNVTPPLAGSGAGGATTAGSSGSAGGGAAGRSGSGGSSTFGGSGGAISGTGGRGGA